jgi:hypothetical protein
MLLVAGITGWIRLCRPIVGGRTSVRAAFLLHGATTRTWREPSIDPRSSDGVRPPPPGRGVDALVRRAQPRSELPVEVLHVLKPASWQEARLELAVVALYDPWPQHPFGPHKMAPLPGARRTDGTPPLQSGFGDRNRRRLGDDADRLGRSPTGPRAATAGAG